MQNLFSPRTRGHLFEEAITFPYDGHNVRAVVVADDRNAAKVVRTGNPNDILLTGRLEDRKGGDAGRDTRVLVFVPDDGTDEIIVSEQILSGQSDLQLA